MHLRNSRPQDGLAIGSAVRAVVSANNRVVARRLNVLLRESRDQMHQRIEPVQAACRQKQQLEPQIAMLVMRQLVAENERRIRPGNALIRQIQRRMDKSGQHRAVRRRGYPQRDFPVNNQVGALLLQNRVQIRAFDRTGRTFQAAYQPVIANPLPEYAGNHACQPQRQQNVGNIHGLDRAGVCRAERLRLRARHPSGWCLRNRKSGLPERRLVALHHIACARHDLHRCLRQCQLHRNEQPQCENRPHHTYHTGRITLFHQPPQNERHERRQRYGQADLHQVVEQFFRELQHKIPSLVRLPVEERAQLVDVLLGQRARIRQARDQILHRAAAQPAQKADALTLTVVLLADERRVQVLPSLLRAGKKSLVAQAGQEREHAGHFPVLIRVLLHLGRRDLCAQRPDGLHDLQLRIGQSLVVSHSLTLLLFYKCKTPFIAYILQ